ncbi:MAG: protein kinase, partial [Planctomycetes bacterium]|nr:protein kinase [Planctomycetota bacterium]
MLATLGSGGYGLVYRAEGADGTPYAIKLLRPRMDPSAARRLLWEARVLALLRHPRLVHCHDVGIELGHPYIVLEYLPGGEVTVLRQRYPQGIPREILLHVALDAAEGLAALHAAGLCHRDVKPANLLFDHEGR